MPDNNKSKDFCCAGKTEEEAKNCTNPEKCCENIDVTPENHDLSDHDLDFDFEQDFKDHQANFDNANSPSQASKTSKAKNNIYSTLILVLIIIAGIAITFAIRQKSAAKTSILTTKRSAANLIEVDSSKDGIYEISALFDKNKLVVGFQTADKNFSEVTLTLNYKYKDKSEKITNTEQVSDLIAGSVFNLPEDIDPQFVSLEIDAKLKNATIDSDETTPKTELKTLQIIPIPDPEAAFGAFSQDLAKAYPMLEDFKRDNKGVVTITINEAEYNKLGDKKQANLKECLSSFDIIFRAAGYVPQNAKLDYTVYSLEKNQIISEFKILNGVID